MSNCIAGWVTRSAGSTVSYAGVAHVSKKCLEYSMNFLESVQKKKEASGSPASVRSQGSHLPLCSFSSLRESRQTLSVKPCGWFGRCIIIFAGNDVRSSSRPINQICDSSCLVHISLLRGPHSDFCFATHQPHLVAVDRKTHRGFLTATQSHASVQLGTAGLGPALPPRAKFCWENFSRGKICVKISCVFPPPTFQDF